MSDSRVHHLLVCYDIRKPRRLARIYRCMKEWGVPLQYSVFYCQLTKKDRRVMENELREIINNKADDVRVYGLKRNEPILFMGQKPFAEHGILMAGNLLLDGASIG